MENRPRYKSSEVPRQWREVRDHITRGETVIVEHYGRPVAVISPYQEVPMGLEPLIFPSRDHYHRERDTMDNNMHDNEDTILYVDLPAGNDIEAAVGRPQEILRGYLVDPDNGDGYSPITHSTYQGSGTAYQDLTQREIAQMWIAMEAERRDIPSDELIAVVWRFPWIQVDDSRHVAPFMNRWSHGAGAPAMVWMLVGEMFDRLGTGRYRAEQYFMDQLMQVYVARRRREADAGPCREDLAPLLVPADTTPLATVNYGDIMRTME